MCSCLPLILFLKAIGVTSSVPETVCPRNCPVRTLSLLPPTPTHATYTFKQTE
jgi:hypothetical protein